MEFIDKINKFNLFKTSQEYEDWRNNIFERDNYTCQICNKKGIKLNTHHIKSFKDYPELRLDWDNGICLCENCHKQLHDKEGMVLVIDIDNTILRTKGLDYSKATPIKKRIKHFNRLHDIGVKITYWTARGSLSGTDYMNLTKKQLDEFGVKYTELRVDKPFYILWIDDRAINIEDYKLD